MSKNQIKLVSVLFGVLSFIFGCYYVHLIVLVQSILSFAPTDISFPNLKMMRTNLVTLYFVLSTVILYTAAVSSFGMYKLMRWGRLLAVIALCSYMLTFLLLIITQMFSPFFDRLIYSQQGWFIFYHMNLRIDTFLVPLIVVLFLVLFNLNVFRKNYQP